MNKQKVSIIVPIYNAEQTLLRCLNSLTKQTYTNIEIILIDDGSTDRSAIICETFKRTDSRIRFIKQENTGPAGARNRGIEKVTGEFIQFVDADDYVEGQMTERLISFIGTNDLVICGYQTKQDIAKPHMKGSYSKTETIKNFGQLYKNTIIQSPCNKLYKREIIQNNELLFIEKYSFGEDLRFNLAYLTHCDRVFFTDEALYIYEQNKQSITNSYIENLFEKQLTIHGHVCQFLSDNNGDTEKNSSAIGEAFMNSIIHSATNIIHAESPYTKQGKKQQLHVLVNHKAVQEQLSNFTYNLQARLFKQLIQLNSIMSIFIFLQAKEWLRKNGPVLYKLLRKIVSKRRH